MTSKRVGGLARAAVAILTVVATSLACSQKSPVEVEEPEQPGEPGIFFNWLPALLADQEAARSSHELMQWLDDPTHYPRQDRIDELRVLLERLGDAPSEYREHASGYSPSDNPILDSIQIYVDQARAFSKLGSPGRPIM